MEFLWMYMCLLLPLPANLIQQNATPELSDHMYDVNGAFLDDENYLVPEISAKWGKVRLRRAATQFADTCFRAGDATQTGGNMQMNLDFRGGGRECRFSNRDFVDENREKLLDSHAICVKAVGRLPKSQKFMVPYLKFIGHCMTRRRDKYCTASARRHRYKDPPGRFGEELDTKSHADGDFTTEFYVAGGACGSFEKTATLAGTDHVLYKWLIKVGADFAVNATIESLSLSSTVDCEGSKLFTFEGVGSRQDMQRIDGVYCGKRFPFSVVSASHALGIGYRTPLGRNAVEKFHIKVFYEAVSKHRLALPKNRQSMPLFNLTKNAPQSFTLPLAFILPSLKELKFTIQTSYVNNVKLEYQISLSKDTAFGEKSKNNLYVFDGPSDQNRHITKSMSSNSVSYLSDSFVMFVVMHVRDQRQVIVNFASVGRADSADGLSKSGIPECATSDSRTIQTTGPRCVHTITNDMEKFFKIFIVDPTLLSPDYSNQLEDGCPHMGLVIYESDLKHVFRSQERVGPFCDLRELKLTLNERMPFYVSTSSTVMLLLYTFTPGKQAFLKFRHEMTNCQGLPVIGSDNLRDVHVDGFVYDIEARSDADPDRLEVTVKTGHCVYPFIHPFLMKGAAQLQLNGPAAYQLTFEAAITGRERWNTNGSWVYKQKQPEVEEADSSFDNYEYRGRRSGWGGWGGWDRWGGGGFLGGGGLYRGGWDGGNGLLDPGNQRNQREPPKPVTIPNTDSCKDTIKMLRADSHQTSAILTLTSNGDRRHATSLSALKMRVHSSSDCSNTRLLNSLYLRAEADDCLETPHKSQLYTSSCGVITIPSGRHSDKAIIQLLFPKENSYYEIEMETVPQTNYFCTLTTASLTISDMASNYTATYRWEKSRSRKIKWTTRTQMVQLTYRRRTCPTNWMYGYSKAAELKYNAYEYDDVKSSDKDKNCTIEPGAEKYHQRAHAYSLHLVTTWSAASSKCRESGGYLWNIESRNELEAVLATAQIQPDCGDLGKIFKYGIVAIGLERDAEGVEHRWSEGNPATFYEWLQKGNTLAYPEINLTQDTSSTARFKRLYELDINNDHKVVMAVFSPKGSSHWIKVAESYEIDNLLAVCEYGHDTSVTAQRRAILTNQTLRDQQVFGLQSKSINCADEWFPYGAKCVMLFSEFIANFMVSDGDEFDSERAREMCRRKGGTLMSVDEGDMGWVNTMLSVWGHTPAHGPIWINPAHPVHTCVWLDEANDTIRTNVTQWSLQPGNCSAPLWPDTSYHMFCETREEEELDAECPPGTKTCEDGSCIVGEFWCDGRKDCPAGEDEANCHTAALAAGSPVQEVHVTKETGSDGNTTYVFEQRPSLRGTAFFKCHHTGKIISGSKLCDARQDCDDGSDEFCAPHATRAWCSTALSCDSTKCIDEDEKCDLSAACSAERDEEACGDYCHYWKCGQNSCPLAELSQRVGTENIIKYGCKQPQSTRGNESWPCGIYNPSYMACRPQLDTPDKKECYPRAAACHMSYGSLHCDGQPDLSGCESALCPGKFKCYNSFCIDEERVCDGAKNCPSGEDEMLCGSKTSAVGTAAKCKGKFRCKNKKCIELHFVCDRRKDCDDGEDEELCRIRCPRGCTCYGMTLVCEATGMRKLPRLPQEIRIFILPYNQITFSRDTFANFLRVFRIDLTGNGITSRHIQNFNANYGIKDSTVIFHYLRELILRSNNLTVISSHLFRTFTELRFLDLRENPLYKLEKNSFVGLSRLTHLYLEGMVLETIEDTAFNELFELQYLNLSSNLIDFLSQTAFESLFNLKYLDLRDNPLELVHEEIFKSLHALTVIHTPGFQYCCVEFATDVQCTNPPVEYSNCSDLLASGPLRFCIWILAILACLGNGGVLMFRKKETDQQKTPLSFLVKNLGLADLLMGLYLFIIAGADLHFKGKYYLHDSTWRRSLMCRVAGFLSMLSSEMSVYVLCLITADRIAVIGLGWRGVSRTLALLLVILGWFVWGMLSLLPILNLEYFGGSDTYIKHGVCFLFNLTEGKVTGWEYATAIFIAFNMLALFFLALGYTGTFISILVRVGVTGTMEQTIARKLLLVVLTDCACWVPPIVIGIMSLLDESVDPKLAMWVAVLIFPINSSLNPFLYTFCGMKCDDEAENEDDDESYGSISHFDTEAMGGGAIGLTDLQKQIDQDKARVLALEKPKTVFLPAHVTGNDRRMSRKSRRRRGPAGQTLSARDGVVCESLDDMDAPGTSGQMHIDLSMSVAISGNMEHGGDGAGIASVSSHTIPLSRSCSVKVKQTTQINTVANETNNDKKGQIDVHGKQ